MIRHAGPAALVICLGATTPALAQDLNRVWRASATPYLWASAFEGDLVHTKLSADIVLGDSGKASEPWAGPVVGVRATARLGPKSSLTGYADYRRFGVDLKPAWQIYGTFNYQWTKNAIVSGGYRYYAIDFHMDNFSYDVALRGPFVGLTYRF